MQYLHSWTPADLATAIRQNVQVNLSAYINIVEDMVFKEIMKMFEKERPDLYKVLNTVEGKKWLKENIRIALKKSI